MQKSNYHQFDAKSKKNTNQVIKNLAKLDELLSRR